ncbi:MAG TPA: hypothetical protein VFM38_09720 [Candidatus Limnocylindrales bacterium]|nr:hypothetical protein [Candidatus Limnocylindrales bacterium]
MRDLPVVASPGLAQLLRDALNGTTAAAASTVPLTSACTWLSISAVISGSHSQSVAAVGLTIVG